jgi:hypothetical protein
MVKRFNAAFQSRSGIVKRRLHLTVGCGQCRRGVTIRNFTGVVKAYDLLLVGTCSECRGDVARVVST